MNELKTLHQSAMAYLQEALVARHLGDDTGAMAQLEAALDAESQAAMLLEHDLENEPTRCILFRSAASLAFDCGEYERAISLIEQAKRGEVPAEFAEELQIMYEDAKMKLDEAGALANHGRSEAAALNIVFSKAELDQLFQWMGVLSEAEIKVLRKEHLLVERLVNATASFLTHRNNNKQLRGG